MTQDPQDERIAALPDGVPVSLVVVDAVVDATQVGGRRPDRGPHGEVLDHQDQRGALAPRHRQGADRLEGSLPPRLRIETLQRLVGLREHELSEVRQDLLQRRIEFAQPATQLLVDLQRVIVLVDLEVPLDETQRFSPKRGANLLHHLFSRNRGDLSRFELG